ncbi:hypothetical protein JCM3766R1_002407, partial [Sporobolomyces carnicolor]
AFLVASSSFALVSAAFGSGGVQVGKPDVDVVVKFPDSNPFGRVTNGVSTNLVNIRVSSHASDPLKVVAAHAQYYEASGKERPLRQTTNVPLSIDLAPRSKSPVIPYRFHSENKIGQVGLRVFVDVIDSGRKKWTYLGYEGTVEIVEPVSSWFDLELISLYIILIGFFGSIGYLVYKSYVLSPSSSDKKSSASKRSSSSSTPRRQPPPPPVPAASTTGVVDRDWIPDHHQANASSSRKNKKASN